MKGVLLCLCLVSSLVLAKEEDFDVTTTVFVWTAREAGSDCWAEVITSENGAVSKNVLEPVDFKWDPGFKVGIGFGKAHDDWRTQLYYTWFRTRGKDAIASTPGSIHSAFLGNFYVDNEEGAGLSGPAYEKANITWSISFNAFDLELGQNIEISPSLSFLPCFGIKGGWIDQHIRTKWMNPNLPPEKFYSEAIETVVNDFWGIGPEAVFYSKWSLTPSLYLFGDFSGVMMWGNWSFEDFFYNDKGDVIRIHFAPQQGAVSVARSWVGFGYEKKFTKNKASFSCKIGYEMQAWLNQLQFYSFTAGRLDNALTLQGGTLEACFDY